MSANRGSGAELLDVSTVLSGAYVTFTRIFLSLSVPRGAGQTGGPPGGWQAETGIEMFSMTKGAGGPALGGKNALRRKLTHYPVVDEVEHAGGKLLRRGEFSPGYPYACVADPDGCEVEIWHE